MTPDDQAFTAIARHLQCDADFRTRWAGILDATDHVRIPRQRDGGEGE